MQSAISVAPKGWLSCQEPRDRRGILAESALWSQGSANPGLYAATPLGSEILKTTGLRSDHPLGEHERSVLPSVKHWSGKGLELICIHE